MTDLPVGYGVTANIAASQNLLWHAAARGSIPRIRIFFRCSNWLLLAEDLQLFT